MNCTRNGKLEHHQGDYAQTPEMAGTCVENGAGPHHKIALRWTPPGKRKPGRPKTTWRRTVTQELEQMNLSWERPNMLPGTECNGECSLKPYVP